MDTVTIVEIGAAALALYAGWKSLPRPVHRDGERLLKVTLSTLARGTVEAADGTVDDWRDAVLPAVLFHPAGRSPEAKLLAPSLDEVPTPALEGERALVEELLRTEDPTQRLQRMYVQAEAASEALLTDPALHGEAWDLSEHMAPDMSWDDVATWSEKLQGVLQRRLGHIRAVELGDTGIPLGDALPGPDSARLTPALPEPPEDAVAWRPGSAEEALAAELVTLCERADERMVLLAAGPHGAPLLRALVASPELRDLVNAVVFVDPQWTEADRAWMAAWFTHPALEPEVVRDVPYATLLRCDPDDPESWSAWTQQRLPLPPDPPTGRTVVDVVDFGPLVFGPGVPDSLPPGHLARALALWLALTLG